MANETGLDNLNKELASISSGTEAQAIKTQAKKTVRRKTVSKKAKPIVEKARRKRAIARARLMPGIEKITFNSFDIMSVKPKVLREMILEPIKMSSVTREIASRSDIKIIANGGGSSGQAQAARCALAKAIAAAGGDSVKKMYMEYDRTLLVDDVRQVEPKKFMGPKARARFQKSYR